MDATPVHFESEQGFRALFNHATIGIMVTDEVGDIVVANPNVENLFGYSSVELSGKNIEMLIPKKHRNTHKHHRQRYMEDPRPRAMGSGKDLYALRKDGTEFPVEISLSSYTVDGELLTVAFITDITNQKKYTTGLEKEIALRTQQLQDSLKKERQLSDLKSKFISIASHEFRTPLSTILSSAGLIDKYIARGDISSQLKHTGRIVNSVRNLNDILSDFLSLEKLEEGMVEDSPTEFNLLHLMDEVCEELDSILKDDQTIRKSYPDSMQLVVADSVLIKACLTNLLSNAIKYSEEGTVVDLSCVIKDFIHIQIRDEGIGIPEEDQAGLFGRFFRANNVGNIKGTGLGLNIIKRYVEIMEGEITFVSEPGVGSTFDLTIPNRVN